MQNTSPIDGTWQAKRAVLAGNPFPPSVVSTLVLTVAAGRYTLQNDAGSVALEPENRLEILSTGVPNAGKIIKAIWKRIGGELTICYNLAGDSWPEDFISPPDSKLFLVDYVNHLPQ